MVGSWNLQKKPKVDPHGYDRDLFLAKMSVLIIFNEIL
jgi:hypothetical protein